MKLKARLNDNEHDLILTIASGRMTAAVDDRTYEIEIREPDENNYLLFEGTKVHECRVTTLGPAREKFEVSLRGNNYSVTIIDPKRLRSGQSTGPHQHGSSELVASMPGKIVRVLVEQGAVVGAGDGIIVVEAMKMQNEMKSPKPGVVSIRVTSGDTVNAGDVLAIVE